ncbi:MAG TPA: molybdenum cofactor biosynthesis protein MoaE [Phycisphaerae bacterium]|jgi:molybdopterin synthase catalytic subunit
MGSATVYFFGPAADDAGCAQCDVHLSEPASLESLFNQIYARFPRLAARAAHLRFAINQNYAKPQDLVQPGDEIAVIPPVSGGNVEESTNVVLQRAPIDAGAVRSLISGDVSLGGIVIFEGTTRCEMHPQHGALVRLEYEAYGAMALRQMRTLADQARQRWAVGRLALVHRIGTVAPGEVSVMIAVACPHRGEAFEACRWLIDTLKRDVPIWKREIWADGTASWVAPENAATEAFRISRMPAEPL